MMLRRFIPLLDWLPAYNREALFSDTVAAVIVAAMLIPQALAYALLANLPPQAGLYASVLPLMLYAVFGSSRTLSVGPVAVIALMTAAALAPLAQPGSAAYLGLALLLAFISGLFLLLAGILRLGFLANFLSHPVISGFVSASGIVIAASQLKHLLGIEAAGHNLIGVMEQLWLHRGGINMPTLLVGAGSLLFLVVARRYLQVLMVALGLSGRWAAIVAKAAPVFLVVGATLIAWWYQLDRQGVAVVGSVPGGLPGLTLPTPDLSLWRQLAVSGLLISIVGFVQSISVAQTLAARRRERIDPDQELVGLGAANIGAGLFGGMPVSGGLSRSVVSFDAGARTPATGFFAAVGMALAVLLLTPAIAYLPKATLAATIVVAVLSLVDVKAFISTFRYSRADFLAMLATLVLTLSYSIEAGIVAGVGLSIGLFLYRTSRPHSALIGRVPGTEHFRNVERHEVETDPQVAFYRIDESLYFANARFLEESILELVSRRPELTDIVLVCPAVNLIDSSALESLEMINERLEDSGVRLHMAEVKGPVMDSLKHSSLLSALSGQVFLSTFQAWQCLTHR
ncbi:sulfate permease [Marinobacteraceae bacterium S3BR75-40.1]